MTTRPPLLGDLTPEQFLAEYWQQKPLLIRNAWPGFEPLLSPEELAGLACEEDVTSRLILERGGDYPWQMRFGPFDEDDFAALPETHWTVLVQEVDRLVPEIADFLERFRFVPNWRLDDVQISYAPEHGNAGAHIDNYDVFLFQGLGHRRWQISDAPVPEGEERYREDLDIRLLEDFPVDHDWVLGPGDLLYLPPRIPHYGVALGDCMTYSVGFRAPTHEDLLSAFFAYAAELADPTARYGDPGRLLPDEPGQIDAAALAEIRAVLRSVTQDDRLLDRWFGRYITEPKRAASALPLDEPYTADELIAELEDGATLRRAAIADLAYIRHGDQAVLFVSGEEIELPPSLAYVAPLLTGTTPLTYAALAEHLADNGFLALLAGLVNDGHLLVT